MVVIGSAIGLTAAVFATRTVSRFLYGVDSNDAATIVVAITTIIAVALFAAYWPARRASLVDPMTALRFE
jgi:ABC-type antimicrobial peptide transport system permease subunit